MKKCYDLQITKDTYLIIQYSSRLSSRAGLNLAETVAWVMEKFACQSMVYEPVDEGPIGLETRQARRGAGISYNEST
jgi:hypothetical protein